MSFNSWEYNLNERISTFYTIYHNILTEAMWFLKPRLILGIHSHPVIPGSDGADVLLYNPHSSTEIVDDLKHRILESVDC